MALVIFEDGRVYNINQTEQPEYYDEVGRPNNLFMQSVLETANIGALFFEDPEVVIQYQAVDYSILLIDNESHEKQLPVNDFATVMAHSVGLIEANESVRGSVILVSVTELGTV